MPYRWEFGLSHIKVLLQTTPQPSFEFVIENSMTLTFPFHYFYQKEDFCLSLLSESEKAVEGTDKENIEQEIEIAPTQVWICN